MQIIRAVRSYEYNRARQPEIAARLDKARSKLKSYLVLHGVNSLRLGGYRLDLVEGELVVTRLSPTGFEQLQMQGMSAEDLVQQGPQATSDSLVSSAERLVPTR